MGIWLGILQVLESCLIQSFYVVASYTQTWEFVFVVRGRFPVVVYSQMEVVGFLLSFVAVFVVCCDIFSIISICCYLIEIA